MKIDIDRPDLALAVLCWTMITGFVVVVLATAIRLAIWILTK